MRGLYFLILINISFLATACSSLDEKTNFSNNFEDFGGGDTDEDEDNTNNNTNNPTNRAGSTSLEPIAMGEVGYILALSDVEITVNFQRQYQNPIVIANSPSYLGADTAIVRITNVFSDRMTLRIVEAPDRDGVHTFENLSYLVVEAGNWLTYPGNHRVEAGKVLTDANYLGTAGELTPNFTDRWESIDFSGDFGETPAIWAQVQSSFAHWTNAECSMNRMECSKTYYLQNRQKNENSMGFEVAMQQERTEANAHPAETMGWIAMNSAIGEWSGLSFETRVTEPLVDHMFRQVDFLMDFLSPPNLITGMQGLVGGNPAHLRQRNITNTSFEAIVEEDQGALDPNDPNTFAHGMEAISYFAIGGTGILTATPIQ